MGRGKNKKRKNRAQRAEKKAKHENSRREKREWGRFVHNEFEKIKRGRPVDIRLAIDANLFTQEDGIRVANALKDAFDDGGTEHLLVIAEHVKDERGADSFARWARKNKIEWILGFTVFNTDDVSPKYFVVSHLQAHQINTAIVESVVNGVDFAKVAVQPNRIHVCDSLPGALQWLDDLNDRDINIVSASPEALVIIETGFAVNTAEAAHGSAA